MSRFGHSTVVARTRPCLFSSKKSAGGKAVRLAFGPESLWFHFISVPLVDQPISSLLAGFSSHVNGSHHLFSSRRVSVACRRSKGSRRFALSVAITLPPDEGRQQRAFALLIASDIPTLTYTSDSREREKKTRIHRRGRDPAEHRAQ